MRQHTTRRRFIRSVAGGGLALGAMPGGLFSSLGSVSAADARLAPDVVQFDPEIEPLVRLLEDTPRERLLEEVAARIRGGTSYREVLAALLLAGVRNVQPRPNVGFKFHAVLVVNSAHLASLDSPAEDRWLPIFWALDYFKSAQARDVRENDWTMQPVDESAVPSAQRAAVDFQSAMDAWDPQAVDPAVAGLARHASMQQTFEHFYRYGARDFRDIGHKIIFVANSRRTLECIGWQHAEPVLRSLAYALVNYQGANPSTADAEPDRPWRLNQELAANLPENWFGGEPDDAAGGELLAELRTGSYEDACRLAATLLARGVAPQSIWNAVFAGAGELLMRSPGIVALHAVTSANAIHYAYQASGDDLTRRLLLLQAVAFPPLFRQALRQRGSTLADHQIDALQPVALDSSGADGVDEVFATVSEDRALAASKALALLQAHNDARPLVESARRLIFAKGTDSHDYKFSSAVLEDYRHLSAPWGRRFLAASMFQLRGSGDRDNSLVDRARAALAS
mgnify:CR=1 FL=1